MIDYRTHIIEKNTEIKEALYQLNKLVNVKILFVVSEDLKFSGSITDGDIRRGLIKGVSVHEKIDKITQTQSKFFFEGEIDIKKIIQYRKESYKILPILTKGGKICGIIDLINFKSFLPLDVIIMAGGRGKRLSPLTDKTPKSLLKVGNKAIMQHNVDRLIAFGVQNFWFSVNYYKDQIIKYFKNGKDLVKFYYIEEEKPMGTIGSLSKVNNFSNNNILVINSDILTNLNFEDFFLDFIEKDADISIVTIPYRVDIPYGIIEHNKHKVKQIKEKPSYTYFSNGGIYLMKKEVLNSIPKNIFFNATDLIEKEISKKKKVISYPFSGYWLDIGKPEDYKRAQTDIYNVNFE